MNELKRKSLKSSLLGIIIAAAVFIGMMVAM